MKKTAAKNLKLVIVFTLMICATAAVYSGISKYHVKENKQAASSSSGAGACNEKCGEDLTPGQFVSFRIMQLL